MKPDSIAANSITTTADVEIIFESEPEEVLRCLKYLFMRQRRDTIADIAEELGYSAKQSVYNSVARWEESGVMEKAQKLLLMPLGEEIVAANNRVLERWPHIINRMVSIAESGRSDRTALEAAAWLKREIIDPALEAREEPGSAERMFAEQDADFSPVTVVAPSNIRVKTQ